MSDLRSRLPAQSLMQRTLELHADVTERPSGDALSWYKGALGEIAVAGILAELGPEWTVLHSVPVGRGESDIDHVVIGPPGAFTLNTKSHPGQEVWMAGHGLLVSGQRTNYVGLAAAEAFRAESLLSSAAGLAVPVVSMVVLVSPGRRTIRAVVEGRVRVVADWELLAELRSARRELSDEQVQRVVNAAIEAKTWRPEPLAEIDTADLAVRFNAITARRAQAELTRKADPSHRSAPMVQPSQGAAPILAPAVAPVPKATRMAQFAKTSPTSRRQSRGKRRSNDKVARLIAVAVMVWVFYGAVLPSMQASFTR